MMEREKEREREAELTATPELQATMDWIKEEKTRLKQGQILIKGKTKPYELIEQGILKWVSLANNKNTASDNMVMFVHLIPSHSGRHTHQGGYSLFILEGKGYTTIDGVRYDWEEGDLAVLPIKAGGVEHQHFNLDPDKPSRWLALSSRPMVEMLSRRVDERAVSPEWHKIHGDQVREWLTSGEGTVEVKDE